MHTNFYTKIDLWNNIDAVTSSLREAVVYLSIVGHGANGLFNSTTRTKAAGAIVTIVT